VAALVQALSCQCKENGSRYSDEAEELAKLPERQQVAERLLCLIYIGFIQTVVAGCIHCWFQRPSCFRW